MIRPGSNITVTGVCKFDPKDYVGAHSEDGCKGKFAILVSHQVPFPIDALGVQVLPIVPFIACPVCKAAYVPQGFREFVDRALSASLVLNPNRLKPEQIRFLRLAFDLTQEEVARGLDMTRSHYNRTESTSDTGERLSGDKQVRLKIFYAEKLGRAEAENVFVVNKLTSDSPPARPEIPKDALKALEKQLKGYPELLRA